MLTHLKRVSSHTQTNCQIFLNIAFCDMKCLESRAQVIKQTELYTELDLKLGFLSPFVWFANVYIPLIFFYTTNMGLVWLFPQATFQNSPLSQLSFNQVPLAQLLLLDEMVHLTWVWLLLICPQGQILHASLLIHLSLTRLAKLTSLAHWGISPPCFWMLRL